MPHQVKCATLLYYLILYVLVISNNFNNSKCLQFKCLRDENVTGSSVTDTRGVVSCILAVNRDSGTHPNIFLGIILP